MTSSRMTIVHRQDSQEAGPLNWQHLAKWQYFLYGHLHCIARDFAERQEAPFRRLDAYSKRGWDL